MGNLPEGHWECLTATDLLSVEVFTLTVSSHVMCSFYRHRFSVGAHRRLTICPNSAWMV